MTVALLAITLTLTIWLIAPHLLKKIEIRALKRKCQETNSLVLSYDDGPNSPFSDSLLAIFQERGVKVSFFVLGDHVKKHSGFVKKLHDLGHDIQSHSDQHLHAWKASPIKVWKDLCMGVIRLRDLNLKVEFLRPPYGKTTLLHQIWCKLYECSQAYWTVDSGDSWPEEERDAERVLEQLQEGGVLLMHDLNRDKVREDYVLTLTRRAIDQAEKFNLKIITFSELKKL